MEITVAPLIRYVSAFAGPASIINHASPHLNWENRPKVTVNVTPDTTVATLISEAGRAMQLEDRADLPPGQPGLLEWQVLRIAFYDDLADNQVAPFDTILGPDGSAQWYFNTYDVTMQQILESRDYGLLRGDPTRVYLILEHSTAGDGSDLDYWVKVIEALPYVQAFLLAHGLVGVSRDTVGLFIALTRRLMQQRGRIDGTLKNYANLFAIPRTTRQLAELLKIPEEDVPVICHFLGMRLIDGAWRPVNRPEDKEYRELVRVIHAVSEWDIADDLRKEAFAKILSHPAGQRAKNVNSTLRALVFEQDEGLNS